jgi:amino-acid N-acetyltransferase
VSVERIRPAVLEDWPAIERLLIDANLPVAGAQDHLPGFVVIEHERRIEACAALERYGETALLRSVVVSSSLRGTGLGESLVRRLIDAARSEGTASLLLLTTTAADWFPRFGFHHIVRDEVPLGVLQSEEFRGACPSTAVLMGLELTR